MNKYQKIFIALSIISVLGFMIFKIISKLNNKEVIATTIKSLPGFSFNTIEGNIFTQNNIIPNTPVLLIRFNPGCEECHYETHVLKENQDRLKATQVIMITNQPIETIKNFDLEFHISDSTNFKLLVDPDNHFDSLFGSNSTPHIFIYNRELNLVKEFKGETKIDAILRALQF